MKVSVVEKFYVESNMDVLTAEDIARALGWTTLNVHKYIKHLKSKQEREAQAEEKNEAVEPAPEPTGVQQPQVKAIQPGKAFAKRPERGFVAMTQAESMVGDEFQESKMGTDPFVGMKDAIFRPRKD